MFSKGLGKDGYSFDAQEKMCREHQLDEAFAALIDAISLKPGVVAWLQKAIEIRLKHLEKAQNKLGKGPKQGDGRAESGTQQKANGIRAVI